jgi:transketolase
MINPMSIPSELSPNPPLDEPIFHLKLKSSGAVVSDPKALRALVAIMDMFAVIGGAASHFGGPSAFAEIVCALYAKIFEDAKKLNTNWFDLYNLVNDAGHCENIHYAVKANYQFAGLKFEDLWKFRSIESPLTGHGEAHLFPEGVLLSNGPLGSAFPQSQGLAIGDRLAHRHRVTVTLISDGAIMEGEAKEALAAIPGFAKKNKLAPYVLIISDNNTKLSGRIDQDSFSLEPTFESLVTLGWNVIKLENGHDLEKCYELIGLAIDQAKQNPLRPVALWVKTIKGYGHPTSEKSPSGGHGFPLKSASDLPAFIQGIYSPDPVPPILNNWILQAIAREKQIKESKTGQPKMTPTDKVQSGVSKALIAAAKRGLPIVSVTSDLPGSTGVAAFRKEFPEMAFDVGVAEANMISTAAGLSKTGFIPVVDTFAQFGVTKGALPLLMSSLSKAPMICIFSHIGFQDAADGASHQSLNYLAFTLGIPNVEVWSLSCAEEAESLIGQAIEEFYNLVQLGKVPPTYVFFLGRENFPISYRSGLSYYLRSHQVLIESKSDPKALIVAMGSLVPEAMRAAQNLSEQGIEVSVIHPGYITQPDLPKLSELIKKAQGRVVFVEDHQKIGGFSEHWIAQFVHNGVMIKPRVLGVASHFGQSAYEAWELYHRHGLSAEQIEFEVKNLIS